MLTPNETSLLGIKAEISKFCSIPDHQQGIRCKAPRSGDWGVWRIRRQPAPAKAGMMP
jgi:hypothetical protein